MSARTAMIFLSAMATLGAGCGGGGGGDDGTPVNVIDSTIAIDANTAPDVSGAIIDATISIQDVTELVGPAGFAASEQGPLAKVMARDTFASKTAIMETAPCSFGGQIIIDAELEDPVTVTPGDRFDTQFVSCNEGIVIDGGLNFVITAFTGDANALLSGNFALSADAVYDGLAVTSGGDTVTADGDLSLSLDATMPPTISTQVAGNNFSVSTAEDTITLINYDVSNVDNGSSYTYSTNGTIDSAALQGSVTFQTLVPFEGVGDDYPFVGELLATGANGSTVQLIALSDADVRLQIDNNGDGAIDEVIDTTWAALSE